MATDPVLYCELNRGVDTVIIRLKTYIGNIVDWKHKIDWKQKSKLKTVNWDCKSKSQMGNKFDWKHIRGDPWDGSKSHRRRQSHVTPCMHNFEMAQNSNHWVFLYFLFEISITCLNSELAHFFLVRKFWDGSKFESFLPRIQFLFEFWAISEFSN